MAIAAPQLYAEGVEGKVSVGPHATTPTQVEIPISEFSVSYSCPTADMTNSKSKGYKEGSRGIITITGNVTVKPMDGLQLAATGNGIVMGALVDLTLTLDTAQVFEGVARITGGGGQTGAQATPGFTFTFEGHGVWTGPMLPIPA